MNEGPDEIASQLLSWGVSWRFEKALPFRAKLEYGSVLAEVWTHDVRVFWSIRHPPRTDGGGSIEIKDSILGVPFELAMQHAAVAFLKILDEQAQDAVSRLTNQESP